MSEERSLLLRAISQNSDFFPFSVKHMWGFGHPAARLGALVAVQESQCHGIPGEYLVGIAWA